MLVALPVMVNTKFAPQVHSLYQGKNVIPSACWIKLSVRVVNVIQISLNAYGTSMRELRMSRGWLDEM